MDIFNRLLALVPIRWFSDAACLPGAVLYAVIQGFVVGLQYIEDGMAYVKAQTRIQTATGENVDNISVDFFGDRLPRKSGESDSSFKFRILKEIFREKGTRNGLKVALEDLGCKVLEIYEPEIDGLFTDFGQTDRHRTSDLTPYTGIIFLQRALVPGKTNLLFPDYNYTDYSYMIDQDASIILTTDQDIFNTVEQIKSFGTKVYAVLDPIEIGLTTGNNYTSLTRYYVPYLSN